MLCIESHYHIGRSWWEPVEVLLFQMERYGVHKSLLVQHAGEFDNSYHLESARRYSGRFASVGLVDARRADAPQVLEQWAAKGIEGVRLAADERSPGDDPLAIWRKAASLGLVVSCQRPGGGSKPCDWAGFVPVLDELPHLPIIIEHLGVPESALHLARTQSQSLIADVEKVLALAKHKSVYVKIPPLGEFMPRPMPAKEPPFDLDKVPPVIDMVIDAFGADHVMIGTDPTASQREGFGNAWRYLREYLKRRSIPEQKLVLGGTAASLFRFSAEPRG